MEEKKKSMPPLRATIRFSSYPNEIWKEFKPEGAKRRYAVSNMGRVVSFYKDMNKDGFILKINNGGPMSGARIALKVYMEGTELTRYGKPKSVMTNLTLPVHNLVAENFIGPPVEDQVQVIHLDYDKFNNNVSNLRWATKLEAWNHFKKSENYKPQIKGKKLTADRVKLIKKKLAEGKTKQSLLAKQFGLSEMGIYRIKSGKAWRHVTID